MCEADVNLCRLPERLWAVILRCFLCPNTDVNGIARNAYSQEGPVDFGVEAEPRVSIYFYPADNGLLVLKNVLFGHATKK